MGPKTWGQPSAEGRRVEEGGGDGGGGGGDEGKVKVETGAGDPRVVQPGG